MVNELRRQTAEGVVRGVVYVTECYSCKAGVHARCRHKTMRTGVEHPLPELWAARDPILATGYFSFAVTGENGHFVEIRLVSSSNQLGPLYWWQRLWCEKKRKMAKTGFLYLYLWVWKVFGVEDLEGGPPSLMCYLFQHSFFENHTKFKFGVCCPPRSFKGHSFNIATRRFQHIGEQKSKKAQNELSAHVPLYIHISWAR